MVGTKGKILNQCPNENQHIGDVTALLFHNDHVFTGGADGTIKVRNLNIFCVSKKKKVKKCT